MNTNIDENKWLKELVELQEKLLVCYRIGKNPGNILDKINKLKQTLKNYNEKK